MTDNRRKLRVSQVNPEDPTIEKWMRAASGAKALPTSEDAVKCTEVTTK
jgi:hypothetical protein